MSVSELLLSSDLTGFQSASSKRYLSRKPCACSQEFMESVSEALRSQMVTKLRRREYRGTSDMLEACILLPTHRASAKQQFVSQRGPVGPNVPIWPLQRSKIPEGDRGSEVGSVTHASTGKLRRISNP